MTDDASSFENRVADLIREREALERESVERTARGLDESMERQRRFDVTAAELIEQVVLPRLNFLRQKLEGSQKPAHPRPREARLDVPRTRQRPASGTVTVRFVYAQGPRPAHVAVDVLIVPTLIAYERRYELPLGEDGPDSDRVATFLEEALLSFVTDYFRAVSPDAPHVDDGEVIDPVCGMSVNSREAPFTTRHRNKAYYFCVQACLEAFERNPERYIHRTRSDIARGETYP